MDITLVINPGSASKKYAFFKGGRRVLSVSFEHVGEGYGKCLEIDGVRQECESATAHAFESAVEEVLGIAKREGVIHDAGEIARVGIRIVAPGTFFETHREIDEVYIQNLQKMADAAPLHIPHTITEIKALKKILPEVVCIGVSDSSFHATIPEYARTYSISRTDKETFDVYRFGYHGLSVSSVLKESTKMLGSCGERVIVCHVGSGVSVTAVRGGKSIDTTMGFSPTSGLMMSSRAGDLDSGALLYLMKKKNLSVEEAEIYITKHGGFAGVLGQSDLRIILDRRARGDQDAQMAVDMFVYHIRKTIGAYTAALGGLDLLVFTATAAERNPLVRAYICRGLEGLGIILDAKANEELMGRPGVLHRDTSTAKIVVVHTNEMEAIAKYAESVIVR